jgi:microcystin-dependent protein
MSKDASGVYHLPASDVNPPVSGTVINPISFASQNTDIANELTNSLDRLGRAPMLAALPMGGFRITGMGAPIAPTDTARLSDIGSYLPSGAIMDFAMVTPPSGWLVCDGSAVSRTSQAGLFVAIGTTWGVGDGSTTFNLPDFRGTFRRSLDAGKGLDPARVFASYQVDGFASHTHIHNPHGHTINDPGHSHSIPVTGAASGAATGSNNVAALGAGGTAAAGTGIAINNATTTEQPIGGTETTVKNYAILTCIRT